MSRTLTENQVLKKLNIPDFRHLSKDNIMSFVSMIDKMNPEVAKKACPCRQVKLPAAVKLLRSEVCFASVFRQT